MRVNGFCILLIFAVYMLFATTVQAQKEAGAGFARGYRITLQTVFASAGADTSDGVPGELREAIRKAGDVLANKNYRYGSVYFGRTADTGSLTVMSALKGWTPEVGTIYANWDLNGLNTSPVTLADGFIGIRKFRFEARFPYPITTQNEKTGTMLQSTAYENIVVQNEWLVIAENEPTVIGTAEIPRADSTLLLILTVKRDGRK